LLGGYPPLLLQQLIRKQHHRAVFRVVHIRRPLSQLPHLIKAIRIQIWLLLDCLGLEEVLLAGGGAWTSEAAALHMLGSLSHSRSLGSLIERLPLHEVTRGFVLIEVVLVHASRFQPHVGADSPFAVLEGLTGWVQRLLTTLLLVFLLEFLSRTRKSYRNLL